MRRRRRVERGEKKKEDKIQVGEKEKTLEETEYEESGKNRNTIET